MDTIYKRNLKNIIVKSTKNVDDPEKMARMYQDSLLNKAMKITPEDIKILRNYEKMMMRQNHRILMQLKNQGFQTLKPSDKIDLQNMLKIRNQKKFLIDRIQKQKTESMLNQYHS